MKKMTRGEAITLANTGWWKEKGITPETIVRFQLYQDRLCMDFGDFHEAVEKALGRPVWSHEFARPQILRDEFEGKIDKRSVADSMGLLMELAGDKPVIGIIVDGVKGDG